MNLQRRHHLVRDAVTPWRLELELDLPGGVALHEHVGHRRASDVAAELFQRLVLVETSA